MESIPFSKDPLPKQVTDYCKQVTSTKAEYEAQIEAYKVLCDKYAAEKDKRRRQTMQNLLDFVMDPEGWEMKPTYAFTECLDEALRCAKAAQKSLYPIPFIRHDHACGDPCDVYRWQGRNDEMDCLWRNAELQQR
ncbi:hypothetical protein FB005_1483 [Sinorhizobium medicae]|uniref:hypothetical protein n=1 Tax=Sinorhizobium medicae TaxID=110321 RepID=UPI00119AC16D|nr:hypothetical protein [Sinorhizobium medicae]TWA12533.1 hypothetical protein FB006_15016 [Sinorhizobium medicae]TWA33425.1 hypothetical protein FB005_1483 [Sinorhizobium medicae]